MHRLDRLFWPLGRDRVSILGLALKRLDRSVVLEMERFENYWGYRSAQGADRYLLQVTTSQPQICQYAYPS